ncbi:MAG: DUF2905 domain-containing protein [Rhodothermus sp.]|nr:DUF2905 domain-containing protein [Rhodothermus sp.]
MTQGPLTELGRWLLLMGVVLIVLGGVLLLLGRLPHLPIGRLPGDFSWEKGNIRFYFPLGTMLLVSLVLTLLLNLLLRLFR